MYKRNFPVYKKRRFKNHEEILFLNIFTKYKILLAFIPVLYPVAIFLVYLQYLEYGVNIISSSLEFTKILILAIPTFIVILVFLGTTCYFYFFIDEFRKFFPKKGSTLFLIFLVTYFIVSSLLIILTSLVLFKLNKPFFLFLLFYLLLFFIYSPPFAAIIHLLKFLKDFPKIFFLGILPFILLILIWLFHLFLIRHYNIIKIFSPNNCIVNNNLEVIELIKTNEDTIFYDQKENKSITLQNVNIISKKCKKTPIKLKD